MRIQPGMRELLRCSLGLCLAVLLCACSGLQRNSLESSPVPTVTLLPSIMPTPTVEPSPSETPQPTVEPTKWVVALSAKASSNDLQNATLVSIMASQAGPLTDGRHVIVGEEADVDPLLRALGEGLDSYEYVRLSLAYDTGQRTVIDFAYSTKPNSGDLTLVAARDAKGVVRRAEYKLDTQLGPDQKPQRLLITPVDPSLDAYALLEAVVDKMGDELLVHMHAPFSSEEYLLRSGPANAWTLPTTIRRAVNSLASLDPDSAEKLPAGGLTTRAEEPMSLTELQRDQHAPDLTGLTQIVDMNRICYQDANGGKVAWWDPEASRVIILPAVLDLTLHRGLFVLTPAEELAQQELNGVLLPVYPLNMRGSLFMYRPGAGYPDRLEIVGVDLLSPVFAPVSGNKVEVFGSSLGGQIREITTADGRVYRLYAGTEGRVIVDYEWRPYRGEMIGYLSNSQLATSRQPQPAIILLSDAGIDFQSLATDDIGRILVPTTDQLVQSIEETDTWQARQKYLSEITWTNPADYDYDLVAPMDLTLMERTGLQTSKHFQALQWRMPSGTTVYAPVGGQVRVEHYDTPNTYGIRIQGESLWADLMLVASLKIADGDTVEAGQPVAVLLDGVGHPAMLGGNFVLRILYDDGVDMGGYRKMVIVDDMSRTHFH